MRFPSKQVQWQVGHGVNRYAARQNRATPPKPVGAHDPTSASNLSRTALSPVKLFGRNQLRNRFERMDVSRLDLLRVAVGLPISVAGPSQVAANGSDNADFIKGKSVSLLRMS